MPIRRFINGDMGPADVDRLNIAYAEALRMLHLLDATTPVTEIVANKILEVGKSGVTDPQEIAEIVVGNFGVKPD